ncbi:preprotein translocase subunit SecE [Butyrivibrio sp. YAB3001]|uniref:preprotein translocase subunit SecE n=1 Tax=Butyrivibrio sp. YAB3001 TaxID=1520812 RepID=UPI0008F6586E|nr:preprotein translocase subunit SecE [Butyrivibrio sp. YAB3001]SFB76537.1 preprotein translocase subunit SecE [Butyrivibrio sp. YAB3001]
MEETKVVQDNSETSGSKKVVSAKKNKKSKDGAFSKISGFFAGVKAEFGKIIWPAKDDIIKQTTAVVVVSIICCALIAVLDIVFEYGVNFITSVF